MASISIMVPAFNEELHLRDTVLHLRSVLSDFFDDYEIIVFDDCSTDSTPIIADELGMLPDVKVIHNDVNRGLGYNYRKGVELASKDFFSWIPGDDDVDHVSIRKALGRVGDADLVVPFICNQHERPFVRRLMSRSYVAALNFLFNLKLRYFNGFIICRTDHLREVRITTDSFAFQSEALIRLLKKGHSYVEVPYRSIPQQKTTVFRFKNLVGVARTMGCIFVDVYIRKEL